MSFLAADIGGTYTRLLLAEPSPQGWQTLREQRYIGAQYSGLEAILQLFLGAEQPCVACIAVAGPISEQRVRMTNLPWQLDARQLAARFGIAHVRLLNDFAAQAYGLASLPASDLCTLQAGQPDSHGVRALIGAGTGLGMARLVRCGEHWQALPSQGGLIDFALWMNSNWHFAEPYSTNTGAPAKSCCCPAMAWNACMAFWPGAVCCWAPVPMRVKSLRRRSRVSRWPAPAWLCSRASSPPVPATWPCSAWPRAAST